MLHTVYKVGCTVVYSCPLFYTDDCVSLGYIEMLTVVWCFIMTL